NRSKPAETRARRGAPVFAEKLSAPEIELISTSQRHCRCAQDEEQPSLACRNGDHTCVRVEFLAVPPLDKRNDGFSGNKQCRSSETQCEHGYSDS
ncbi:hypothetical protein, partial [Rhizobacter sp. Root16D2]|uniref:hypothetical protein n=1 Tax=Rhizobacter sp. Root16D2 TaxID=1736479 RepID=UPI001F1D0B8A